MPPPTRPSAPTSAQLLRIAASQTVAARWRREGRIAGWRTSRLDGSGAVTGSIRVRSGREPPPPSPPVAPAFAAAPAPAISIRKSGQHGPRRIRPPKSGSASPRHSPGPGEKNSGRQMKLGALKLPSTRSTTPAASQDAETADHRGRRRQRAGAHTHGHQTALREGSDLRHHRQHRHGDRSGCGAISRSSGGCCSSGLITGGNVAAPRPCPIAMSSTTVPSYAEEADAAVRYLVKIRRIPIRQIAVFAQDGRS